MVEAEGALLYITLHNVFTTRFTTLRSEALFPWAINRPDITDQDRDGMFLKELPSLSNVALVYGQVRVTLCSIESLGGSALAHQAACSIDSSSYLNDIDNMVT